MITNVKTAARRRGANSAQRKSTTPHAGPGGSSSRELKLLRAQYAQLQRQHMRLKQQLGVAHRQVRQYSRYCNTMPLGFVSLDRQGRMSKVNRAFARICQQKSSALLNRQLPDYLEPADRPRFKRFLHKAFSSRRMQTGEFCLLNSKQRLLQLRLEAVASPGRNECLLVITNITRQQQEEQQRRASESLLQAVFKNAPFEFWVRDRDQRMLMQNTAVARHWGSMTGQRPQDSKITPEILALWESNNRRALAGEVVQGEIELKENGQKRWMYNVIAPFGEEGRIWGILGFNIDITDRKRAEEAVRESARRDNALVNAITQFILLIDPKGTILAINPAMAARFQAQPARLIGKNIFALLPARTARERRAKVDEVVRSGKPLRFEDERDGVAFDIHVYPALAADGQVTSLAIFAMDITERKQAEAALREARDELEVRVEQRTLELHAANRALQEALELNRNIVEASEVGISAYKASGECIFVNPALARITGVPQAELMRQNFRQLPAFRDSSLLPMAEQALATGKAVSGEVHTFTAQGREIWGHCHQIPFTYDNKPHLLHMLHDISEQKSAERFILIQRDLAGFLSQTNELAAALGHLMQAALQIPGVDCGGIYINDPAAGGFVLKAHQGLSPEFVQAAGFYAAGSARLKLLEAGRPIYSFPSDSAVRGGDLMENEGLVGLAVVPFVHEGRLLGSFNFASRTYREIPESSRTAVEALSALVVGAVARIQTEAARRESDQRLRAIVENTPIIVFSGTAEGVITYEDGRALRNLGFKPGQNVGRRGWDVYSAAPEIADCIRRVIGGEEINRLLEFESIIFDTWYTPIRDESGRVTGYFGIATDVTERVRLERQIIEISDRVQASFGQEIHDGLCQVLVGAAFDANTLRQRVAAALPEEEPLLQRLCRVLDEAISDARRLSRGLFPVKLENYGLTAALRELTGSVGRQAQLRTRFTEVGGPVLITNNIAATHLFRIAQEALNNAVKHAGARQVIMRLALAGQALTLTVTDDGRGIRRSPPRGQGLGLHTMEYRARALGGALQIRPGARGGTEVVCTFPWPLKRPGALAESPGALPDKVFHAGRFSIRAT